ncbi:MAG: hypothetical protein ACKVZH_03720 [Blastocatellia bacterium]
MIDERPRTYLTILTKNDLFSFLGLVRAESVDSEGMTKPMTAIIKHDPREGQPILKQFQTGVEALRNYEDAISTSLDRGWSVVYRGLPLEG